jgi:hypothetical protein
VLIKENPATAGCPPTVEFAGDIFPKYGPTSFVDLEWFHANAREPSGGWLAAVTENQASLQPLRARLSMDPATVRTAHRVLRAISRRQPLLLEGEPATSKTAVATFAALLLGLPVIRVCFGANTREDLVLGGFLPSGRPEDPFAWNDGAVTSALQEGGLLLLDEPNLAAPGMLDRMLSLLEDPPSLRLVERDGRVIKPHPRFRVIAAMNPSEHTGRRPLSPAFRDRFVEYQVEPTSDEAIHGAIQHWIHGRFGSTVNAESADYALGRFELASLDVEQRLCPSIGTIPAFGLLTPRIARVAATLTKQCRVQEIGRDRSEAYRFGRRQLSSFFQDLEAEVVQARMSNVQDLGPAFQRLIQEHFLHPFATGTDREAVRNLLVAEGLDKRPQLPTGVPTVGAREVRRFAVAGTTP